MAVQYCRQMGNKCKDPGAAKRLVRLDRVRADDWVIR